MVMFSIFMVVRLVGFLRSAAGGDVPVSNILLLLALKLVSYVDVILPLMLYISVLMVLGRWNRDNEMTALAASGVGLASFLRPMLFLVALVGGLISAFTLYLAPLSVRNIATIEQEYRQSSEISGIVPGVFAETKSGGGVYFVEQFDPVNQRYNNVFVYNSSFRREGVVVSKYARQHTDALTNDQFLVLESGTRYEGNPGDPDYRIMEFETYAVRLRQRPPIKVSVPLRGLPTTEILATPSKFHAIEWNWRLSKLVSLPILILFALTFSYVDARRSRMPGMFLAFLAYFTYTNLLGFGVALMKKGSLDPNWGLWWIHGGFLVLGVYFFYRRNQNQDLIPYLRRLRTS